MPWLTPVKGVWFLLPLHTTHCPPVMFWSWPSLQKQPFREHFELQVKLGGVEVPSCWWKCLPLAVIYHKIYTSNKKVWSIYHSFLYHGNVTPSACQKWCYCTAAIPTRPDSHQLPQGPGNLVTFLSESRPSSNYQHVWTLLGNMLDGMGFWETQHSTGPLVKLALAAHFRTEFQ